LGLDNAAKYGIRYSKILPLDFTVFEPDLQSHPSLRVQRRTSQYKLIPRNLKLHPPRGLMDKKLPKMYPLEEENNGLLSNSLLTGLRLFDSHTGQLFFGLK
jgi:hypothetical protein